MINFDKNSTTSTKKEIWDLMERYAVEEYANPSALYPFADEPRKAIAEAKEIISAEINCSPNEIYFVSSGTEADNWIIKSFFNSTDSDRVFVTSSIEHHAILNMFAKIEKMRAKVVYLPVDRNGIIDGDRLEWYMPDANLCSIMYVNNEIGTIQDINYIGHLCREHQVPFHTDAVQAFGKIKIDVDSQCIDFLSCSGHKFHAPRGIGFIYVRDKFKDIMSQWTIGGQQQGGLIAGTENVPGIVGIANATKLAYENLEHYQQTVHELYYYFKSQLKLSLPKVTINGGSGIENCMSVCFAPYKIKGEEILAFLGENDICASSGSACASESNEVSHVLKAIGLTDEEANSTIRFSFDDENTKEEVDEVIKVLINGIQLLGGLDEISE